MREKFFISSRVKKQARQRKYHWKLSLIANLKYENEELTKKNEKLTNTLKLKSQQLLNYSLRLGGAHVLITKLRKQVLDKDQFTTASLVLNIHFLGAFPPRIISILSPNIRRTTQFMAEARFMQHTYMLSFQKASLATQLIFVSISDSLVVIHQHSFYPLLY